MAHCYICDFSETVISDFYGALATVDPVKNKVVYDDKIDKYVCVDCIGASLANYRSLEQRSKHKEYGEVEFEVELEDDTNTSVSWNVEELESYPGDAFPSPD